MSDFLDNLKEAVGENPLSAALIGGGALWLLFGNERLKSAAASVSAATARPLADSGPICGRARPNSLQVRRPLRKWTMDPCTVAIR